MSKDLDLPAEEVVIKMSTCNNCKGMVKAAVKHMMSLKDKNQFMREAMEYNLLIKEIPLLEYKELTSHFDFTLCTCPSD